MRQPRIGGAHGPTSASTTSRSTRLRDGAHRQCRRSRASVEISLSLDSVLVISVKVRRFCAKSGPAPARRPCGFVRAVLQQLRVGSMGSVLVPTRKRRLAMVSSNSGSRHLVRHGFLMEELLDAILELIGLFLADVLDPRPEWPSAAPPCAVQTLSSIWLSSSEKNSRCEDDV